MPSREVSLPIKQMLEYYQNKNEIPHVRFVSICRLAAVETSVVTGTGALAVSTHDRFWDRKRNHFPGASVNIS